MHVPSNAGEPMRETGEVRQPEAKEAPATGDRSNGVPSAEELDSVRPSGEELAKRAELRRLLGARPRDLAKEAFGLWPDEIWERLHDAGIYSQKDLAAFLGVAESTVSGWLKEDRIPQVALLACLLLRLQTLAKEEIERLERLVRRPRIIREDDRFHLVAFDEKPGEWLYGRFIARDITDETTALLRARLDEIIEVLEFSEEIFWYNDEDNPDLRSFIRTARHISDLLLCFRNIKHWKHVRSFAEDKELADRIRLDSLLKDFEPEDSGSRASGHPQGEEADR